MKPFPTIDEPQELAAEVRQRLPVAVRVGQILDAAALAFGANGFAATRIDDIARLAGLSKGGIYTHFRSKDEIFEALLARSLTPASTGEEAMRAGELVTVDLLIAQIIDPMYERLGQPQTIVTLRLLMADGTRVPQRVAQWREAAIDPYLAAIERLVRRGVRQGTLRKSVLEREPWLMLAPGVFAVFWQLVLGDAKPGILAEQHKAHVAMLREMLEK